MSRLHRAGNPHGKQLTCPVTTTTKIVKKVPLAKFLSPGQSSCPPFIKEKIGGREGGGGRGGGRGGGGGVEKRGLIPEQRLLIESTLKSDTLQLTAVSFCSST